MSASQYGTQSSTMNFPTLFSHLSGKRSVRLRALTRSALRSRTGTVRRVYSVYMGVDSGLVTFSYALALT